MADPIKCPECGHAAHRHSLDEKELTAMDRVLGALYPKAYAGRTETCRATQMNVECPKCEDGMVEYLIDGSASKTETAFCSCSTGRARAAGTRDALEARGEEHAR